MRTTVHAAMIALAVLVIFAVIAKVFPIRCRHCNTTTEWVTAAEWTFIPNAVVHIECFGPANKMLQSQGKSFKSITGEHDDSSGR